MKKTLVLVAMFLAALLAGLFVQSMRSTSPLRRGSVSDSDSEDGKERFFQREIGMPLDMQSTAGPVGVAGYSGTPPLLGSEPKPVPERPYEKANDTELFQFEGNRMSADCCPSPFSGDRGCICLSDKQVAEFASRGGNRSSKD